MIGIDLFCGAGGMSIGAEQAGINVLFAVESDPCACATYEHNNKKTLLHKGDISLLSKIPVKIRSKEPIIVFGGPPCQGFSTSNRRTRNKHNNSNWLFKEFIRVIKLVKPLPEWILFENVRGFSETENGLFLEFILNEIHRLGYTISYDVLNSVNYGIPQKRRRFFAIGSLNGNKINFPNITHPVAVTVNCAIADLPILKAGSTENWLPYKENATSEYAKLLRGNSVISPNHNVTRNSDLVISRYKHVKPGGNWEQIPKDLMSNYKDESRCHTGIYHRLKSDEPSIVIGNFRKNMLIHPNQHRGLSVREAARIQSFPDWFEFKGSIGFQQQQVGNAVPPILAETVFKAILKASN